MGVPANGILDIVTIVYFAPALFLALYVALKHGFDRQAGWLNLVLLGVFRLVGSILGLVGIYSPSSGVITTSLVLSSMGTVSLVGALLGIIGRVNQHMSQQSIPPRATRFLQLAIIAAIVLAIINGTNSGTDHNLLQAAVIILLVVFLITAAICLYVLSNKHLILPSESRLLYAALLSLPFMLVRVAYAIASAFNYNSSLLSMTSTTDAAVVTRAILGTLMEFIVVALFLWAGLTVEKSAERGAQGTTKYQSSLTPQAAGVYGLEERTERQKPVGVY